MTKAYHRIASLAALSLAVGVSLAGTQVQGQAVGATPEWCKIDDPGTFEAERAGLIASGVSQLPTIPCPDKNSGNSIPQVMHLPMPCGRTMVFQRVDVPASHPLEQVTGNFGRVVDISAEQPQVVLSSGPWSAPIAGAFSIVGDGQNGATDALTGLEARAYYIGRYEVTSVQWAAFEMGLFDLPATETDTPDSAACAGFDAMLGEMNLRAIPAQGNVSWFDGIAFSRAYSQWLMARDRERLEADPDARPDMPWEQGAPGYVRLPTEAEWEFAARGGASHVTPQARSNRMPAILDPETGQVRQAALAEVCAEKPRAQGVFVGPVGRKLPNVLGLYDVLCNAEEIVLNLFQPTRPDGLSGQIGGVIAKGGASGLGRDRNTIGRRSESAALFNLNGEGKTSQMGLRLAVSAPVFIGRRDETADGDIQTDTFVEGRANPAFDNFLMSGREQLLEQGIGLASNDQQSDDLAAEVNKLRRSLSEGELTQQQLLEQAERLQVELDRLETRLGQEARDATLLTIRTGVVTSNLIDRMGRNFYSLLLRIDTLSNEPNLSAEASQRLTRFRTQLPGVEARIQAAFDLYLQVHTELASRDAGFVSRQIAASRTGVGGLSIDVFGNHLSRFENHFREVRVARGRVTEELRAAWLDQLDTTRAERRDRFPRLQPR